MLDAKATKDNKIQIVVPKGQSFATADPLIYVQVFNRADKPQALADFARTSNARWIAANPKSKVTELPPVERATASQHSCALPSKIPARRNRHSRSAPSASTLTRTATNSCSMW